LITCLSTAEARVIRVNVRWPEALCSEADVADPVSTDVLSEARSAVVAQLHEVYLTQLASCIARFSGCMHALKRFLEP
jgi:hypothetical protein